MAEDAFQRRNGWPMLFDDVGHLNGQLKESVLKLKRRRQINNAHFYDFGAFIFSRENGVTGPSGAWVNSEHNWRLRTIHWGESYRFFAP